LVEYLTFFILGMLILNVMVYYYMESIRAINDMNHDKYQISFLAYSLLAVALGILIEWQKLKIIFIKKPSVNWLLLPSLFLLIASLIPMTFYVNFFGLGDPWGFHALRWIISPLRDTVITHISINILSGILLVRSLT
jgi:hypothetical protein